jgi:pimeloyl-ACP methyl ester carboxylesterase
MAALLLYLVGILVLAYAVWGLALLFLQPRLLYRPTREVSFTPADLGLEYEAVAFRSADGVRLTGWYIPGQTDREPPGDGAARFGCAGRPAAPFDATARRPDAQRPSRPGPRHHPTPDAPFTVLVCHGNGGNIGHLLGNLGLLSSLGLSCLAFDYRGYGHSSGRPTEAGTYLDAQAAYDWLTGAKSIPPEQIILLGRSLGASVAAHLAGRVRVAGLAAEGAFTSYVDIAARFYPYLPVRLFRRFLFHYDTLAYIKDVRCPVMVLHSRDDELVPFALAARLFEAAREPKQFVELFGSHSEGFLLSGDLCTGAWRKWLDFVKDYQAGSVVRGVS